MKEAQSNLANHNPPISNKQEKNKSAQGNKKCESHIIFLLKILLMS